MPLADAGRFAIAAVFTAILTWAAVSDIRVRKIPNWTVLALLGLFGPWVLAEGVGAWALWALAAGAIALVVSIGLYAAGMVGAGDSKLVAAVALFAGLAHLPLLALGTALTGGLIAGAIMVMRPRRALVMFTLRGKGDFGRGIPYGVAIAIAGAGVVWGELLRLPLPYVATS